MTRRSAFIFALVVASALGCTDPVTAHTAAETDETDETDETEAAVCDYADVAGPWQAQRDDRGVTVDIQMLWSAFAEQGELVASVKGVRSDGLECDGRLLCLARAQNDWRVVQATSDDGCHGQGYRFFRLEQDGTMAITGADSEFGERTNPYFMTRVE